MAGSDRDATKADGCRRNLEHAGVAFESVGENKYVSSDQTVEIKKDAEVRVRVVGMRIDASEIFCIATIKEDYLGVIGDPQGDL